MTRIEQEITISAPIDRCFDLARSVEVHLKGTEQTKEEAIGGVLKGLLGENDTVTWRAKHLGVRHQLTSRITKFHRPTHFQDTMIEGPFTLMQHDHYFSAIAANCTIMRDSFVFAAPFGMVGLAAERLILAKYLDRFLMKRNQVLKHVAESGDWKRFILS